MMDPVLDDLESVSLDRLEAAIGAGAARIAAMQCKWLVLLAEFVKRRGFDRWAMTAEHWLSWRCGIDRVTAREHLRVAQRLVELPTTKDAFAQGRLSYSKVRAITRVATADDESDWVNTAIGLPASKLARLTGQYRTITKEQEQRQTDTQSLSWRWDENGMFVATLTLTPDRGAAFIAAVSAGQRSASTSSVDSAEANAPDTVKPVDSAEADLQKTGESPVDALLHLVHGGYAGDGDGLVAAASPEVVLHVSVGDLASDHPARRHLENGPAVGPGAARRLACDPILTALLHDESGQVVDVGRRHRLVTRRLRRAIYERDGGYCTFPGCTNFRWLEVHHIIHWEDGGRTDRDNLLLLCDSHHDAHHNGAFGIAMSDNKAVFELSDAGIICAAPTLAVVPPPPGDLLATADAGLGPIEGDWDGEPIDRIWILDGFARSRQQREGRMSVQANTDLPRGPTILRSESLATLNIAEPSLRAADAT